MILFYRTFNSVIFLLINFCTAFYACQRLIRAMVLHYRLVAEVTEFNFFVNQSRQSLDYVSKNIQQAMEEIEDDLAKELQITSRLTNLKSELTALLKRFSELEEIALEWMRMTPNMKSIKIETPNDINEEVKKILSLKKNLLSERPKTPKQTKISTTTFNGLKDPITENPFSKFLNFSHNEFLSGDQPKGISDVLNKPKILLSQNKDFNNVTGVEKYEILGRPRTPIFPEVELLREQKPLQNVKTIGFRNSWDI